ncbi:MAG: hypothetical protein AAB947_00025 [Patescibacteria group bacterium]
MGTVIVTVVFSTRILFVLIKEILALERDVIFQPHDFLQCYTDTHMKTMERFLEWIGVKQRLAVREHAPPLIREGDLWWCGIGENVGIEINGKSRDFTRPVIVAKKFGRLGFLGIPTSTRKRTGTWYVSFHHKGIEETALLSQVRIFSYKRLHTKMGELETDFRNVKEALARLVT